jgi:thiamine biosynthesis lipoprotein
VSPRRFAALLAFATAAACASRTPETPHQLVDGRYAMGTVLEITLHGGDPAALARARDRVFDLAARLDALMSSYRESSDVSRLNAAGGAAVAVHPDVAALLRASTGFTRLTRGSFDVTVGPLVALWTQAAERGRLPEAAEIAAARERVDASHVRALEGGRVALASGARIDLGGVAKGFALDRMLPLLRQEGISSALLSFGQSSAWAVGAPPDAAGWRLLARAPDGGFAGFLTLRDRALSVSGSFGASSEIGGRRFGHVIDPRSGWPLTRSGEAIVVSRDAALAEALSKALLVLGADEGLAVVEAQPGCHGLLLEAGGRRATRDFDAETRFEPLPPDAPAAR